MNETVNVAKKWLQAKWTFLPWFAEKIRLAVKTRYEEPHVIQE
jgi:hypothetical protein